MKIYVLLSILIFSMSVQAQEAWMLPAGVRTGFFRYMTADTAGAFDANGNFNSFNFEAVIDLEQVRERYEPADRFYNELKNIDPELVEDFNLLEIEIAARGEAKAQVFALGYGISDRLTLVGYIPVVQAKVTVDGIVAQANTFQNVSAKLGQVSRSSLDDPKRKATSAMIKEFIDTMPAFTGHHAQDLLVSQLGYDPVGTWEAQGFGDIEIFLKYLTLKSLYHHHAIEVGSILPTGRTDDPDNLTDFAFGDGSWGTYLESIHDFFIRSIGLTLSPSIGYRYFWPTNKEVRLIESQDVPISSIKENTQFKKGDEAYLKMVASQQFLNNFYFDLGYEYKVIQQDSYNGEFDDYDYNILEENTQQSEQILSTGLVFSTIDLFKKKKFALPMRLKLNHERVFAGQNTQRINYYQLDWQIFF